MVRSTVFIALIAIGATLLSTLFLIQQLGFPNLNVLDIRPWLDDTDRSQGAGLLSSNSSRYLLGVGKSDITGPVVEINFMGYADPKQLGSGVRQRLYSRAFIIGSPVKPAERLVYLVLDTQSGDTAIRHGIIEGIRALGPDYAVYGEQNVAVTGTHSHSGPGAWLNYLLPQITSRGFDHQSYDAIVKGTVESVRKAHESLCLGELDFGSIRIDNANINRSPYAYLANPDRERSRHSDDVDKNMTLLKFRRSSDQKDVGILTWFPVHGTSMFGNNTLVTGDNKGLAALLFEKYASTNLDELADDFVAGFSQSNVGDTSPDVMGAFCESGPDVGKQCDFKTSLCGGKNGPCHGRGPHWGLDDAGTASTYEIGTRQFESARDLFESMQDRRALDQSPMTSTSVHDDVVRALHVYVDFANRTFILDNGTQVRTCPAAMGYSFAAGTTDGPGAFDFKQHNDGEPDANGFWKFVRNRLHEPGPEQVACHGTKPILLDIGETFSPYQWGPNIVDFQLLRVGQLYIIVSPGEATTMAGRRWKETLLSGLNIQEDGGQDAPLVVLGGPANSYTHYITTPQEYDIQRYEGASTLYGPHTLDLYLNLTSTYLPYLSASAKTSVDPALPPEHPFLGSLDPGPSPPIFTNKSLSFITPVIVDRAGFFQSFGQVLTDVLHTYRVQSAPTISATFVGANPRNNLRLGGTFAAVEKYDAGTGVWRRVRDDDDWSLVFEWTRTSEVLGTSSVKISWELSWEVGQWGREEKRRAVEQDVMAYEDLKGTYRLRYFGDSKALGGAITAFEGASSEFVLS